MAEVHFDLERISTAEKVKQEILRRVMEGELVPGTRVTETAFAREFQTSQAPIREAFRELEAMDILATEPYKGSRVRAVSVEEMRDAYLVRASLEELAGRLAARSLKGAVDALKREAGAVLKAARARDVEEFARRDFQLHRMIMQAAGKRILLRTWDSLAFESRMRAFLIVSHANLVKTQEAHWEILEALDEGNGSRAGRLLRSHILKSADANEAE